MSNVGKGLSYLLQANEPWKRYDGDGFVCVPRFAYVWIWGIYNDSQRDEV